MEFEITDIDELSDQQKTALELHSFYNVINVLSGELQFIGVLAEDEQFVKFGNDIAGRIKKSFINQQDLLLLDNLKILQKEIQKKIEFYKNDKAKLNPEQFQEAQENIKSVFEILEIRLHEFLTMKTHFNKWLKFDITELKRDIHNFFSAIEKNAKGRYHIVYDITKHNSKGYYVNLNFSGFNDGYIEMPTIMKDVIKDLLANARKYTEPGGRIYASLREGAEDIRIEIEDTGMGIPENEIEKVANYGERASNVQDYRTMGGGFGLTKAYVCTKRFDGRMWIKSELGKYTKIRILIPKPK